MSNSPSCLVSPECYQATCRGSHQRTDQHCQPQVHSIALLTSPKQENNQLLVVDDTKAFVYIPYLQCTVLVAIDLHISVTVAIQRSEHDAEGSSPVTKQHEETVTQRLLREDIPPVVY